MDAAISQTPFDSSSNYSPQPRKKSRRLILLIFLIILIVAGVFFGKKFLGVKSSKSEAPKTLPSPTAAETQSPTDTPSPSPTPEELPISIPKPTVNPVDKDTGLDRSVLSVAVQNGSGIVGAANKSADILKGLGYKVIETGNADNFNYETAAIKVKGDKSNYLPLLKKDLGFSYTIGSASADLSSSSTSDALIIIGK